ncbi:MAG: response regulator [Tahibacter sp.]
MPRILIADDNPLSLQFFATVLAEYGFACETAADGADALRRASDEHFDLLLLDLNMPQLGGPEVLQRLRADPATLSHASASIATSAEMHQSTSNQLLQNGFSATLPKPVSIQVLIEVVRQVLHLTPAEDVLVDAVSARTAKAIDETVLLDDAQALSSCGDTDVVQAMRAQFVEELALLPDELRDGAAHHDDQRLRERVHRLRASCGFCGAIALNRACLAWSDAALQPAGTQAALERVIDIAVATRARLQATG